MGKAFGQGDERLSEYVERLFPDDDAAARFADVRARQQAAGVPDIAVSLIEGLMLEVLTRAAGARRAVEIGTLGGWSGSCIARGLADGGVLHTFELDERHARVAEETFARAGVSARVRIHLGTADKELPSIEAEGPFDLAFIDADKVGYPRYLEWAAEHLRVGGVVLGDNAFAWGHVLDGTEGRGDDSPDARAGRALVSFNEALARGGRFRATMLPTAEGMAMGVKVR